MKRFFLLALSSSLLLGSSLSLEAKYVPAKCLGVLSAGLTAMAFSEFFQSEYCRRREVSLNVQSGVAIGLLIEQGKLQAEIDKECTYWEDKTKAFEARANAEESVIKRIHKFCGVRTTTTGKMSLDGVGDYLTKALKTAGLALLAAGFEYGMNS